MYSEYEKPMEMEHLEIKIRPYVPSSTHSVFGLLQGGKQKKHNKKQKQKEKQKIWKHLQ